MIKKIVISTSIFLLVCFIVLVTLSDVAPEIPDDIAIGEPITQENPEELLISPRINRSESSDVDSPPTTPTGRSNADTNNAAPASDGGNGSGGSSDGDGSGSGGGDGGNGSGGGSGGGGSSDGGGSGSGNGGGSGSGNGGGSGGSDGGGSGSGSGGSDGGSAPVPQPPPLPPEDATREPEDTFTRTNR